MLQGPRRRRARDVKEPGAKRSVQVEFDKPIDKLRPAEESGAEGARESRVPDSVATEPNHRIAAA